MANRKQEFKNLSLKQLEDQIQKNAEARNEEIKDIKHCGNKLFWSIVCNPLTYCLILAFFAVWFYCENPRTAMLICSTYLLEFFILRFLGKN